MSSYQAPVRDMLFTMKEVAGFEAICAQPGFEETTPDLVEAVLEAFTDPDDLVFEPFCGSGTQLIAAERTGRRCCAVELDPVYCDVAVRRWEMATGRKANSIKGD